MRRVLRGIGWLLVALAGAAAITAFVARHSDGPIGPFPGGPLVAGELVSGPEPDWSFAAALPHFEIEVGETTPRSRTVWLLVDQGELFVPAGFASHKNWPAEAMADGRVVGARRRQALRAPGDARDGSCAPRDAARRARAQVRHASEIRRLGRHLVLPAGAAPRSVSPRVPVVLVSGFLGAGKTTLVRHLLADARRRGLRVAVVSNELGELGIDRVAARECAAKT